jgi:hypothetical protein
MWKCRVNNDRGEERKRERGKEEKEENEREDGIV